MTVKVTIGIIGPKDLVDIMLDYAKSYSQYEFLGLCYEDENEAADLFQRNKDRMSVCLFPGNWPYFQIVKRYGSNQIGMPMVYVQEAGPAIHKTIARILLEGVDVRRLSIDTMSRDEAQQSFSEIGLGVNDIHFMPLDGPVPRQDIVSFHKQLWDRGQSSAAVTFLRGAYETLHGMGIPIYRCTASIGALKEAVVRAVVEARSIEARASQIVVGLLEGQDTSESSDMYKSQRLKAMLFQALLEWGESHGASVVPMEGIKFGLFMTRGALEEVTQDYKSLDGVSALSRACGCKVFFGFGTANTASMCYANASLALNYARELGHSCVFIVLDEGRVIGPLGSTTCLEFKRTVMNPLMVSRAKATGMSITTLGKVQSALKLSDSDLMTPEQLAKYLGICKRNARRILSRLEEVGLARACGLDQPGTRGRPQKIYKIDFGS